MLKINNIKYVLGGFILIFLGLTSCEDPIDVPSQFEESQLVVDAWLTNTNSPQVITLSGTVDYFGQDDLPLINGASIILANETSGETFLFAEEGEGRYVWRPRGGESFGEVGDQLALGITVDGKNYVSTTDIARTAPIDSIGIEFEEGNVGLEEGLYAQLYARDPAGRGDSYLIRAYKNDILLNRPTELTAVFDAVFDPGADVDGTYFIPPIRFSINPLDDDGAFIPYKPGDRIYAEVHSINEVAFRFLNIAVDQINNEGIFSIPIANSPSNIFEADSQEPILGIFNVAQVSSIEKTVE